VLEDLRSYDAILLGAVGPPVGDTSVPPGTLERGLLLRLRFELDLYVNLRPFTGVPGSIAEGADFVVVRENTEGTYAGEGGFLRRGTPHEVATQGSVNTRMGVERCARFAFELAARRPRHRLTLVHKSNVLTFAGDLWTRTVTELSSQFPDVEWDYNHVDAACIYLVEQPGRYDVIVTDNLFGDILTDLAGAVSGGIGFAASANLNPARTGPSLFEPVHGAAHDIAGRGVANPLAAIHSAALMLEHLGETDAARRILKALAEQSNAMSTMSTTSSTPLSTTAVGDAIAERL
jgi:3-isopropylmalate dehydrogenase